MTTRHEPQHKHIDGIEHKLCHACNRWLPLLHFCGQRHSSDGLRHQCRRCAAEEQARRNHERDLIRRRRGTITPKRVRKWIEHSTRGHEEARS